MLDVFKTIFVLKSVQQELARPKTFTNCLLAKEFNYPWSNGTRRNHSINAFHKPTFRETFFIQVSD